MDTIWVVLIALGALIIGLAIGVFVARKMMMSYLKKNPPINEQMLRTMMMQMGQKPSQKKINQMMRAMNQQMDEPKKKNKLKGWTSSLSFFNFCYFSLNFQALQDN